MKKYINCRRDARTKEKETHGSCVSTGWIVVFLLLLSFAVAAQQPLSKNGFAVVNPLPLSTDAGLLSSIPDFPTIVERPVLTIIDDGSGGGGGEGGGGGGSEDEFARGNGDENGNAFVEGLPIGNSKYLMIVLVIVYGIIKRRKLRIKN